MALPSEPQQWNVIMRGPLSAAEKEYFKALGVRIAQRRKELGFTQVQVSNSLKIAQQRYAAYETGFRRIQVSLLPALARVLMTDLDSLLGAAPAQAKRGPASKLQRYVERIEDLPKPKQEHVMEFLEDVLARHSR